MPGTRLDMPDKAFLLLRKGTSGLLGKQVGKTYDRVQGGTQFVAHGCEEIALQTIGLLYFAISNLQFRVRFGQIPGALLKTLIEHFHLFFHRLAVGYVSNYADDPWSGLPFEWAQVDIHSKFCAIRAQCSQVQSGSHGPDYGM